MPRQVWEPLTQWRTPSHGLSLPLPPLYVIVLHSGVLGHSQGWNGTGGSDPQAVTGPACELPVTEAPAGEHSSLGTLRLSVLSPAQDTCISQGPLLCKW